MIDPGPGSGPIEILNRLQIPVFGLYPLSFAPDFSDSALVAEQNLDFSSAQYWELEWESPYHLGWGFAG